jgi:hypothetical protein
LEIFGRLKSCKELAVEVTGSQSGAVAKAKAAYDYLFTKYALGQDGLRLGTRGRRVGLNAGQAAI